MLYLLKLLFRNAFLAGAGALRSTANDLLKFLAANLQLVSSPLNPILQKTQAVQAQVGTPGTAIALGWHLLNHHETEIIFHDGGTGGFRSFLGFVEQKRLGIVVLSNAENDVNDIGLHLLESRYPLAKHPHLNSVRQSMLIPTYWMSMWDAMNSLQTLFSPLRKNTIDSILKPQDNLRLSYLQKQRLNFSSPKSMLKLPSFKIHKVM
jgi:CubicO group peptidase (beta-lactamase class C family)